MQAPGLLRYPFQIKMRFKKFQAVREVSFTPSVECMYVLDCGIKTQFISAQSTV